jgi:hypothetical protein
MDIVILGLAVWRIASLLSAERGPYAMFEKIREWCGVRYTVVEGVERAESDREIGKLILCPWCSSVWLGAIASILYLWKPVVVWMALPLALSALAIIVNEIVNHE